MLTEHEIHHLDALQRDIDELRLKTKAERTHELSLKGVPKRKEADYLLKVETDINNIRTSGVFPEGLDPSDIHDYLEKNRKDI
jgi:hypothetical protein